VEENFCGIPDKILVYMISAAAIEATISNEIIKELL
jgi:hypothetical protein